MRKRIIVTTGILALFVLLCLWGCDPDQETPDYTTVSGRIYADSMMTQGVSGVAVVVESDEESQSPYNGPDQFAWTDSDGYFEVSFYLGHSFEGTELTHFYIADCAVSYWYNGQNFAWSGGVTVASGKTFHLPNVHLGQFE